MSRRAVGRAVEAAERTAERAAEATERAAGEVSGETAAQVPEAETGTTDTGTLRKCPGKPYTPFSSSFSNGADSADMDNAASNSAATDSADPRVRTAPARVSSAAGLHAGRRPQEATGQSATTGHASPDMLGSPTNRAADLSGSMVGR